MYIHRICITIAGVKKRPIKRALRAVRDRLDLILQQYHEGEIDNVKIDDGISAIVAFEKLKECRVCGQLYYQELAGHGAKQGCICEGCQEC